MTGPLISADRLRATLVGAAGAAVTVLDVRYRMGGPTGPTAYAEGHVPGAAYVDLDRDLAAPPGEGGRHPLPELVDFVAAMRRAGVSGRRPVVVYDDWSGQAGARAWWLLRHHGHRDVRVLDGAWPAWVAAGGAISTGMPEIEPGDFDAGPSRAQLVETRDVLDVDVLVDARAAARYRGDTEPIDPVGGHIPGAVNVPTAQNLTDDGRFRSPAELAAVYAEVGVVPGADVAAYCGSGVTATHDLLAMEVAGIRARLYPGSWSGWITDPTRPVATGASGG